MARKIQYPDLIPLWIAVYIDVLGFSILAPLFPYIMNLFNTTSLVVGLLMSMNAMFGLFFGYLLSSLSDKYGRKPLLLISQAGTLAAFLLFAFSTSLEMLFFSRIVDGIFGGNFPIARAIIGDKIPPRERSKQMSNIGVAHVLASLIGPGIGGVLSNFGLIAPGMVGSVLSACTIILTAFMFKETLPSKRATSSNVQGGPVQQAALKIETPARNGKDVPIRNNKVALFYLTTFGIHTVSFTIYVSTFSLYANIALGLTPEQIGYLMMFSGVIRIIVRFFVFEPIINKFGDKPTMMLGLGVFVVSFFLLAFATDWVQVLLIQCATSFAASCSRGPLNGFQSRSVTPRQQGRMMGMVSSLDNIAQVIGPIVGGFILGGFPVYWFGILVGSLSLPPFVMSFKNTEIERDARTGTPVPALPGVT